MSSPPSRWRWNEMPQYNVVTSAILEERLRAKFGNYKFYVQRKTDHWRMWVPRDLTEDEKILLRNPDA